MNVEKKEPQELRTFEWRENPSAPRIYADYLYLGWTLDDIRITFGALKAEKINSDNHFSEEQGSVAMTWRQAKNLRDMLIRAITSYEEKNGEITIPYLADPNSKQ
jgi:hypothetical protein